MNRSWLPAWTGVVRPVVGMLHGPALPGAPAYGGNLSAVREAVLRDAEAWTAGGAHGLMLENYHDAPFFAGRVPPATVAHLTALAAAVRRRFDLPLGINVLRNDGCSALAVAQAAGAQFIRVNILCGARLTDQGVIAGIAAQLMRDRARLGAEHVKVLADVNVKHSAPLAAMPLEQETADLIERGRADGLIVSGSGTGRPTDLDELRQVQQAAGAVPVFIGSGVTAESIAELAPHADGFVVGSSVKTAGRVDADKVRALIQARPDG